MKIAIYHDLPSGGAKRTLYEFTKRASQRHTVDVYTLETANHDFCDLRPFTREHYIYPFAPLPLFRRPIGRLNQLQRWRDLCRLDRASEQIAAEIDARGYDVVLVEPCRWTQAPAILAYLRTPAVYFCHEPPRVMYERRLRARTAADRWRTLADHADPLISLYHGAARRADRDACRAARVILVNSQFMRGIVARLYGVRSIVCYHGIDTDSFRPDGSTRRRGYVLSVGAIEPHKGFEFLIHSVARLAPQRPRLRLVGNAESAEYRGFLDRTAAELGVEMDVEVGVSQEILVQRYNEAALFAYSPHAEPFGLAPLEAMACGTPVVAVAEGGVCETVVDGVTGRLTSTREPGHFADAMGELLQNAPMRERYGQQAREYVLKHWNWDAAAERRETQLQAASVRPAFEARRVSA